MQDDLTLGVGDVYPRQRALFDAYVGYYLRTIRERYDRRGERWQRDFSGPEAYERSVEPNRRSFRESLGGWPWERAELGLGREPVAELPGFRVERLTYTLFEEVRTDALLLVPEGEGPWPAVLCQVGVNGAPETILGFTEISRDPDNAYHQIGRRLAGHGYAVIGTRMVTGVTPGVVRDQDHRAPHLMTEVQREVREYLLGKYDKDVAKDFAAGTRSRIYLDRLCRMIGHNLMGTEMFALSRAVDVLESLPEVRGERIGMYGLSQGGMSALWLPALEKRIIATVASASFNERHTKQVVSLPEQRPFVLTSSEDKIFAHMDEFADSDKASLICPRAFCVESGREDGSVFWKMADVAFAEVKAIYEKLGIGERCEIVRHEGGHELERVEDIADARVVKFLDRYLQA
jgi:dienelactone hydrolase